MDSAPNVILISADSLRADHLGCYGYSLPTSPRIDRMAAEGALCERVFCPGIPTQPSHSTMYTGQHPLTHGVVAHGGTAKLRQDAPFLPELYLEAGYSTCAVDTLFRERNWFGRGFEYLIDPSVRRVFYASVTCEELNERAIGWIRTVPRGPFFMFLHYWDVHYPYVPPDRYQGLFYEGDPVDPRNRALDPWWTHPIGAMAKDTWLRHPNGLITDPKYVTALYDREIRHLDDGVGELLAALAQHGVADNTLVMLLADHGESMTEHGIFFDHYGLYDCTLRVPLIVSWPARVKPGVRLPEMLQLSDVAPTLLDACDLPIPESMEGRSFFRRLTGEDGTAAGHDRIISVEATWQSKWSLRTERHKFILSREPDLLGNPMRELYDLAVDPREESNLAERQPDLVARLEAELERWIADRLRELGRNEDPLRAQGPSMLATWIKHRA